MLVYDDNAPTLPSRNDGDGLSGSESKPSHQWRFAGLLTIEQACERYHLSIVNIALGSDFDSHGKLWVADHPCRPLSEALSHALAIREVSRDFPAQLVPRDGGRNKRFENHAADTRRATCIRHLP